MCVCLCVQVFSFDPASHEGAELVEYVALFLDNLVPVRSAITYTHTHKHHVYSIVKYTITGALESSTSTSTGALECEGSDLRVKLEYEYRVLEFYTLKLASKSARTRRSRLSCA